MLADHFSAHHRSILSAIVEYQARAQAFALCMVVDTEGSTYRKAGALAVVAGDGTRRGVISGGCLESSLEQTALESLHDGLARYVVYDTHSDDDVVFGSGSGCRGRMHLLFVPVLPETPNDLCEALRSADSNHRVLKLALVTVGHAIAHGYGWQGTETTAIGSAGAGAGVRELLRFRESASGRYSVPIATRAVSCAVWTVPPTQRLLLIGAGPESPILLDLALLMGWRVTLCDHRQSALLSYGAGADHTQLGAPLAAVAALSDQHFDACVIMTHSASNDLQALCTLALRPEGFIGLLGPPARRDELLEQLAPAVRHALVGRLHAPVGLRVGGNGPEALALSIGAELQNYLSARPTRAGAAAAVNSEGSALLPPLSTHS